MKRYLVFAGSVYYPSGGWDDFVGAYDTITEARAVELERGKGDYSWAHTIDTETMEVV
jgi:hypothetical protein